MILKLYGVWSKCQKKMSPVSVSLGWKDYDLQVICISNWVGVYEHDRTILFLYRNTDYKESHALSKGLVNIFTRLLDPRFIISVVNIRKSNSKQDQKREGGCQRSMLRICISAGVEIVQRQTRKISDSDQWIIWILQDLNYEIFRCTFLLFKIDIWNLIYLKQREIK